MKKTKIFTMALLLTTLAVGCTKDETNDAANTNTKRLTLFAEGFGNSSKSVFNPGDVGGTTNWVEGDSIAVNNGTGNSWRLYDIKGDEYMGFRIEDETEGAFDAVTKAIYAGQGFDGNVVEINGDEINGYEVVLNSLTIRMDGDQQQTSFPMVANKDGGNLYFKHLTAGICVTLANQKGNTVELASLRIVAQSTNEVENLTYDDGTTARWAVQGPSVPSGTTGSLDDEISVANISAMNFNMRSGDDPVSIDVDGELTFWVPVTIKSFRYLTLTGYDENGVEVFHVTKDFGSDITVDRNNIYNVPTVIIQ